MSLRYGVVGGSVRESRTEVLKGESDVCSHYRKASHAQLTQRPWRSTDRPRPEDVPAARVHLQGYGPGRARRGNTGGACPRHTCAPLVAGSPPALSALRPPKRTHQGTCIDLTSACTQRRVHARNARLCAPSDALRMNSASGNWSMAVVKKERVFSVWQPLHSYGVRVAPCGGQRVGHSSTRVQGQALDAIAIDPAQRRPRSQIDPDRRSDHAPRQIRSHASLSTN